MQRSVDSSTEENNKLIKSRNSKKAKDILITITEPKHVTTDRNHIEMTMRIDGTETEFIVDTRSPVRIIPPDKKKVTEKEDIRT